MALALLLSLALPADVPWELAVTGERLDEVRVEWRRTGAWDRTTPKATVEGWLALEAAVERAVAGNEARFAALVRAAKRDWHAGLATPELLARLEDTPDPVRDALDRGGEPGADFERTTPWFLEREVRGSDGTLDLEYRALLDDPARTPLRRRYRCLCDPDGRWRIDRVLEWIGPASGPLERDLFPAAAFLVAPQEPARSPTAAVPFDSLAARATPEALAAVLGHDLEKAHLALEARHCARTRVAPPEEVCRELLTPAAMERARERARGENEDLARRLEHPVGAFDGEVERASDERATVRLRTGCYSRVSVELALERGHDGWRLAEGTVHDPQRAIVGASSGPVPLRSLEELRYSYHALADRLR